jgi:4-amino-4-deoxy-L-arabinose transferase-like glycosyltransferase
MVAAAPVLAFEPHTDWRHVDLLPHSRPEFQVGRAFVEANSERFLWLFTVARWACLPFTVLGGWICYRWGRELYGQGAGLVALMGWCLCPNILAHAELLTPDLGATALAVTAAYTFWRWVQHPSWLRALGGGCALGLALLTKFTCLVFLPLWPLLWLAWHLPQLWPPRQSTWLRRGIVTCPPLEKGSFRLAPQVGENRVWKLFLGETGQLAFLLVLALGVVNAGYGFEGSFQRLGEYCFHSKMLGGAPDVAEWAGLPGQNRFTNSWVGDIPIPLPQYYLIGMDVQRCDFEGQRISYLRGEFRNQGWWYYYLYGLAVKVPVGTWMLLLLAGIVTVACKDVSVGWRHEMVLLAPLTGILTLVSSQTGLNQHLRYVLPVFPFAFIWISRVASAQAWKQRSVRWLVGLSLAATAGSSLRVYPHSLSYFNELAGGPLAGPRHLLDSNIDWGQDLLHLKSWLKEHPQARPIGVAYFGFFDPEILDPDFTPVPEDHTWALSDRVRNGPPPGWYALSVNSLYGYALGGIQDGPLPRYEYFRSLRPVATAGYSMYIYRISPEGPACVRQDLGLVALSGP